MTFHRTANSPPESKRGSRLGTAPLGKRPWVILASGIILLFFGLPGYPGDDASGKYKLERLSHNGRTRLYWIKTPKKSNKKNRIPLVIVLHGGNATGRNIARNRHSTLHRLAAERGFAIACPEGIERKWQCGSKSGPYKMHDPSKIDDVGFLSALIDDLIAKKGIDPGRVYMTGISNGAMMAQRFALEHADRVAGIAAVCGHLWEGFTPKEPSQPVPTLVMSGTKDPLMPYRGGYIGLRKQLGKALSAEQTVQFWIKANRAEKKAPKQLLHDTDPKDGTRVRKSIHRAKKDGAEVAFYSIENGGHTWPGPGPGAFELFIGKLCRDIDASKIILEFFMRHSRSSPKVETGSLRHENQLRTYRLHLPPPSSPSRPPQAKRKPLIILLHAGGGSAEDYEKSREGLTLFREAHQKNFMVVCPQGINGQWNDGRKEIFEPRTGSKLPSYDDVGFISKLIDHLDSKFGVDRKRVYATGISNGGFMSIRLGLDLSHKIAAVAPVTAHISVGIKDKKPTHPISVLLINGTKDPLFPFNGGTARILGGKSRGEVLSTQETIERFRASNHCEKQPTVTEVPDRDPTDGTRVTISKYGGGKSGTEVILVKVDGGGHTWPGGTQYLPAILIGKVCRDINASKMVVAFFARQAGK